MIDGPIRPFGGAMMSCLTAEAILQDIEASYRSRLGPGDLPRVNHEGPRNVVGLIAPHAGYRYSGPGAAHCYARLAADGRPDVLVIVGVNHGSRNALSAIQTSGGWETPLGVVPVEEHMARRIADTLPELLDSATALEEEHSLEVQLPFLQHLYGDTFAIVPIMVGPEDLPFCRAAGTAIAHAMAGCDAVIVASTDMTHYEPRSVAERQDGALIELMLRVEADDFWRARERSRASVCGYAPVTTVLTAARALGATRGEKLSYYTSGEMHPGPVVGYASVALVRD